MLRENEMNFEFVKFHTTQKRMKLIIFDFILTNYYQPRPYKCISETKSFCYNMISLTLKKVFRTFCHSTFKFVHKNHLRLETLKSFG